MTTIRGSVLGGGGIRGVLSLAAIQNFEKKVNTSFYNYFNICFGESTGTLEGSLFMAGEDSNTLLDFYKKEGKNIFTPQHSWFNPIKKMMDPVYDRNRVLGPYKELAQQLGVKKYGDIKKKFVGGSVNVCDNKNYYFKTTSEKWADRNVEDIIVRSFSAPYFFGFYIDPVDGSVWADGGSGDMNNPIIPCFLECLSMANPGDDIEIVSFGTGYVDYSVGCDKARQYNKVQQIWDFFFAHGDQLGRTQAYADQVEALNWIQNHFQGNLPKVSFKNYDITIPSDISAIDQWKNIDRYVELGNSIVI